MRDPRRLSPGGRLTEPGLAPCNGHQAPCLPKRKGSLPNFFTSSGPRRSAGQPSVAGLQRGPLRPMFRRSSSVWVPSLAWDTFRFADNTSWPNENRPFVKRRQSKMVSDSPMLRQQFCQRPASRQRTLALIECRLDSPPRLARRFPNPARGSIRPSTGPLFMSVGPLKDLLNR